MLAMKRMLLPGLVALLGLGGWLAFSAQTSMAQDESSRPILVELFTSQGCSSCPPADELAVRLSDEADVLMVSLPVDYWDYLGWKDTLAQAAFTQRQRAYAEVQGKLRVYTPQMMIDGREDAVGSRESKVRRLVERRLELQRRGAGAQAGLRLETNADGGVVAHLSSGLVGADSATLWLVQVESRVSVAIGRGENRGRTITYANVASKFERLGTWSGGGWSIDVPTEGLEDTDGLALILQADVSRRQRGVGEVLATAWVKRPTPTG